MLIIVSPAKKLNMNPIHDIKLSKPFFKKNIAITKQILRKAKQNFCKDVRSLSKFAVSLIRETSYLSNYI